MGKVPSYSNCKQLSGYFNCAKHHLQSEPKSAPFVTNAIKEVGQRASWQVLLRHQCREEN